MNLKYLSLPLIALGVLLFVIAIKPLSKVNNYSKPTPISTPKPEIKIKSIDTMKYSRDISREKLNDSTFDEVIKRQVSQIAQTGATHIAVGTPYDKEFVPFLARWVKEARQNKLKIWFRGNFSGWEKWFNYPRIDRKTHIKNIETFIKNNPDLFEDGDIFTPCAECENGGPGDPRNTGDVQGYRNFLIEEYNVSQKAFKEINKKVNTGFFSMNYDVAKLIMDKQTTSLVGGIVTIDHYVASPQKMIDDIEEIAKLSSGKVVIGEFGAPIPDIHGKMSESEQAQWLKQTLSQIFNSFDVLGVNYWVNVGGSTQIWDEEGKPREAVSILKKYFSNNF